MSKIILLDNNMINQIAAGEVVERPSSVVKELIENSIDAGATNITIEIKDGGTSLIRVSDNGSGIEKDDVKKAFLRNATSKIKNIEDLTNVLTLGFRGEALASIVAVSQVEMLTKTSNDNVGSFIEIHGGEIIKENIIATTNGTSIIIRNLFYNVPARRKFLKKNSAETALITDIVNKFVLSNPNISFKYIVGRNRVLESNGNGDLKTAIFNVYGKEVLRNILDINYQYANFKISGFIGKSEISRKTRSYENLFLNGRYIKNKLISSAIEESYKTRLPIGKFPFYVLNLEVDPSVVDVNVHPTKLEVRFSEEDNLYDFILKAMYNTLENTNLIPIYKNKEEIKKENTDSILTNEKYTEKIENNNKTLLKENTSSYIKNDKENLKIEDLISSTNEKSENILNTNKNLKETNLDENILNSINNSKKILQESKTDDFVVFKPENKIIYDDYTKNKSVNKRHDLFKNYRIVGQVLDTYWIIESNKNVYVIDQHAAHERILYEKFLERFKSSNVISQRLLEPQVFKINSLEKQSLDTHFDFFKKIGFEIEIFDSTTVAIKSVPILLKDAVNTNFFLDVLDKFVEEKNIDDIYDEKLHEIATMACKSAVKANDKLTYLEAKELIEQICCLKNPFTCPHGRPTIIEFRKYEIEKLFKRIQ